MPKARIRVGRRFAFLGVEAIEGCAFQSEALGCASEHRAWSREQEAVQKHSLTFSQR